MRRQRRPSFAVTIRPRQASVRAMKSKSSSGQSQQSKNCK